MFLFFFFKKYNKKTPHTRTRDAHGVMHAQAVLAHEQIRLGNLAQEVRTRRNTASKASAHGKDSAGQAAAIETGRQLRQELAA